MPSRNKPGLAHGVGPDAARNEVLGPETDHEDQRAPGYDRGCVARGFAHIDNIEGPPNQQNRRAEQERGKPTRYPGGDSGCGPR